MECLPVLDQYLMFFSQSESLYNTVFEAVPRMHYQVYDWVTNKLSPYRYVYPAFSGCFSPSRSIKRRINTVASSLFIPGAVMTSLARKIIMLFFHYLNTPNTNAILEVQNLTNCRSLGKCRPSKPTLFTLYQNY